MPHRPARARRAVTPIAAFLRLEAAAGIVLLGATVCALVSANAPWSRAYGDLWARELAGASLRDWVAHGLMAGFFLVVGTEIRRERFSVLPVVAAAGGMVVPALVYLAVAGGDPALRRGWAIPTATDVAFAVGIVTALGRRVPPSLRAFLLALAIADDVGAIVVVGVGFGRVVAPLPLVGAALGLALPPRVGERVGRWLHPWSAYVVLPLFALAQAGIPLSGDAVRGALGSPVAWAVAAGLVVGKPVGIVLATLLAVRLCRARLPDGVTVRQLAGVGLVAGTGFTISLYVTTLAFGGTPLARAATFGILAGSTLAALAGAAVLRGR